MDNASVPEEGVPEAETQTLADALAAAQAAAEEEFAAEADTLEAFRDLQPDTQAMLASTDPKKRRAGAVRAAREGLPTACLATVLRKMQEKDALRLAMWATDRAAED